MLSIENVGQASAKLLILAPKTMNTDHDAEADLEAVSDGTNRVNFTRYFSSYHNHKLNLSI